jgi:hypothetical protein
MEKAILVGDIGSTKSTWCYGTAAPKVVHLKGYNPMAHPITAGKELFTLLGTHTENQSFSAIWYYGAGVVSQETIQSIHSGLQEVFPDCVIHVHSDLVGACIAACGEESGTVAILGTGSHAAAWDGHKIRRQATSLGYILGDEGSGCDIGKALIQAYFYQEMPGGLRRYMEERLPAGRNGLLSELQSSRSPNQYLADFARVAVMHQEDPWVRELITSRFNLFIRRHLLPLQPKTRIHVVGSIGCIFASLISQELAKHDLAAGTFIKDPASRLYERHLEHGKK